MSIVEGHKPCAHKHTKSRQDHAAHVTVAFDSKCAGSGKASDCKPTLCQVSRGLGTMRKTNSIWPTQHMRNKVYPLSTMAS